MKLVTHLILILCCCVWSMAGHASNGSSVSLVMVMGEDGFPFQFVDNDGEPTGLLVGLWKEWAKQTHTDVVFVVRHWHQSLEQLQQAKAQVHIGMGKTPEREAIFDFGPPIADVGTYLYLHKSLQGKKSIKELVSYQIGLVAGSSLETELSQFEPKLVFKRYESREKLLAGVAAGETLVFAGLEGYLKDSSGAWTSHYLLLNKDWSEFNQYPNLEFSTNIYVLARSNDPGLIKPITNGFSGINSQEFVNIEQKWMINPNDSIFNGALHNPIILTPAERTYIEALGEVKIGYLKQWPPMEFTDEKGEFAGINCEVAKLLQQQLQLKLTAIAFDDWHDLIQALQQGEIAMAGSVAQTAERQSRLAFSDAYWPSPWG